MSGINSSVVSGEVGSKGETASVNSDEGHLKKLMGACEKMPIETNKNQVIPPPNANPTAGKAVVGSSSAILGDVALALNSVASALPTALSTMAASSNTALPALPNAKDTATKVSLPDLGRQARDVGLKPPALPHVGLKPPPLPIVQSPGASRQSVGSTTFPSFLDIDRRSDKLGEDSGALPPSPSGSLLPPFNKPPQLPPSLVNPKRKLDTAGFPKTREDLEMDSADKELETGSVDSMGGVFKSPEQTSAEEHASQMSESTSPVNEGKTPAKVKGKGKKAPRVRGAAAKSQAAKAQEEARKQKEADEIEEEVEEQKKEQEAARRHEQNKKGNQQSIVSKTAVEQPKMDEVGSSTTEARGSGTIEAVAAASPDQLDAVFGGSKDAASASESTKLIVEDQKHKDTVSSQGQPQLTAAADDVNAPVPMDCTPDFIPDGTVEGQATADTLTDWISKATAAPATSGSPSLLQQNITGTAGTGVAAAAGGGKAKKKIQKGTIVKRQKITVPIASIPNSPKSPDPEHSDSASSLSSIRIKRAGKSRRSAGSGADISVKQEKVGWERGQTPLQPVHEDYGSAPGLGRSHSGDKTARAGGQTHAERALAQVRNWMASPGGIIKLSGVDRCMKCQNAPTTGKGVDISKFPADLLKAGINVAGDGRPARLACWIPGVDADNETINGTTIRCFRCTYSGGQGCSFSNRLIENRVKVSVRKSAVENALHYVSQAVAAFGSTKELSSTQKAILYPANIAVGFLKKEFAGTCDTPIPDYDVASGVHMMADIQQMQQLIHDRNRTGWDDQDMDDGDGQGEGSDADISMYNTPPPKNSQATGGPSSRGRVPGSAKVVKRGGGGSIGAAEGRPYTATTPWPAPRSSTRARPGPEASSLPSSPFVLRTTPTKPKREI